MAVGNVPGSAQLNFMAGSVAVQLREAALAAQRLANYVSGIGVDGLIAAGFTADDAETFIAVVSGIGVLSGIYFGTQTLELPTDFSRQVQSLAGPS